MTTRRMWFWNLLLFGIQASAVIWAHSVGASWLTLAAELVGLLLLGVAAFVYVDRVHVPRASRRFQQRLAASLAAHAAEVAARDAQRAIAPVREAA